MHLISRSGQMLGMSDTAALRSHGFMAGHVGETRAVSRDVSQKHRIVATKISEIPDRYELSREFCRLSNQYRITRRRIQIPAPSITAFPSQTLYGGIAPSLPRSRVRASSG